MGPLHNHCIDSDSAYAILLSKLARGSTDESRLFGNRWFAAIRARSEQSVLSFVANRSSFLIGELLLRKLSETVVVQGNAPHDRPGFLVSHRLIGNRASFLRTKAPMLRVPDELSRRHHIN